MSNPIIYSVFPAYGFEDTTFQVTIKGTGFDDPTVTFSNADITVDSVDSWSATEILVTITIAATPASDISDVTVENADTDDFTLEEGFFVTAVYSVPDCRDYFIFPNVPVDVQGTLTYTRQVDSRTAGAPVDSRDAAAPVDSRVSVPENSRTFPPF